MKKLVLIQTELAKMTMPFPCTATSFLSASACRTQSYADPRIHLPYFHVYKQESRTTLGLKQFHVCHHTRPKICRALNLSAGNSNEDQKMKLRHMMGRARKLWDASPEPVRSFPWDKVLDNFLQLILDLIIAVLKCLCVPVLAVTSLSEMSYCAHERKLSLVPIPFLFGFALAGILQETALEVLPRIKESEVPWHLLAIAIFFIMVKLPGPYYPFWGRIIIPHIANGILWRTLWFTFRWSRRPHKGLKIFSGKNSNEKL